MIQLALFSHLVFLFVNQKYFIFQAFPTLLSFAILTLHTITSRLQSVDLLPPGEQFLHVLAFFSVV